MEYLIFALFAAAFLLFLFIQGVLSERKQRKWFMEKLKKQYGQAPEREYKPERFVRIPGYFENHRSDGQIDDITWNDLGMDEIFKRMNYTLSSAGEEYLYYRLRTPETDKERLVHFHRIAEYFGENEEQRIAFQLHMRKLGTMGKYSLYDYLEYMHKLGKRSNVKSYVMIGLLFAGIGLMTVNLTLGILATLGVICYQMFSYYTIRKEIEPYITSLVYMMRLNETADKVQRMKIPVCEEEFREMRKHIKALSRSRQGRFWVFHDEKNSSGGNPIDGILVYIKMIFHTDLILFNRMVGEMNLRREDIDALIGLLGTLECAVSVSLFRASVEESICVPEFKGEVLRLEEGYHPLIEQPVKNSIQAGRSVLLTGSNASGKSTFLKMVAVNVLLAQTIYTVCGKFYQAPFYRLFTSMSLRDDLAGGESYYIVEIKAIKRIMEAVKKNGPKVICFVDEVLRGTNTTERIAASSQILRYFHQENALCFAATHDLELTELLRMDFDNYHFEEEIAGEDIFFNYLLCPGKASTKNAIRLLQLMGYDEQIIANAHKQAEDFENSGIWKLT